MTAESFARHDCHRRYAAPSSSGHGRSPGDHPCWPGLRPRRQLRQRATEGRPRQRRWATRTPPRHGTAATCALASFLVVVVQRGGRRFGSCSCRRGGQFLAGRSPSGDTLHFAHFHPALASLAFRQSVRATSTPPGRGRMMLCAPRSRRRRLLDEFLERRNWARGPVQPSSHNRSFMDGPGLSWLVELEAISLI